MSILNNILSRIIPGRVAREPEGGESATPAPAAASSTAPAVDVDALLSGIAAIGAAKLNWQTSIVDLMKVLGLDSSLASRKELARELHYTGDTNDSATMNTGLQKQVLRKFAENGGKLPE